MLLCDIAPAWIALPPLCEQRAGTSASQLEETASARGARGNDDLGARGCRTVAPAMQDYLPLRPLELHRHDVGEEEHWLITGKCHGTISYESVYASRYVLALFFRRPERVLKVSGIPQKGRIPRSRL